MAERFVSPPMKIGKHEWRIVQGEYLDFNGVKHPTMEYEWRVFPSNWWHRSTEWPSYDHNDGEFMGMPRSLVKLWNRHKAEIEPIIRRLFIGVYPCGLVYADRFVEVNGDYKRLAFLSYSTLQLELEKDCPWDLADQIKRDAAAMQAKAGHQFPISTCNQTVTLGTAQKKDRFTVTLSSVGNPDYQQYAPISNEETVICDSLDAAAAECRRYIEEWDLGGGNWTDPIVYCNKVPVAKISYNGRIWTVGSKYFQLK